MSKLQPAVKRRRSNDASSTMKSGNDVDVGMHEFLPVQGKATKRPGAGLQKTSSSRSSSNHHKKQTNHGLFSSLLAPTKTASKQPPSSKRKRDAGLLIANVRSGGGTMLSSCKSKKEVLSFAQSGKENATQEEKLKPSGADLNGDDESDDDLPLAHLALDKSQKKPRIGSTTHKPTSRKVVSQKSSTKKAATLHSFIQPKTTKTPTLRQSQATVQSRQQKTPGTKSKSSKKDLKSSQVKPQSSRAENPSTSNSDISAVESQVAEHENKPTASTAVSKISGGKAPTLSDIQGHFIKASEMLKGGTDVRLEATTNETNTTVSDVISSSTTSAAAAAVADESNSITSKLNASRKRRSTMDDVTPEFDATKDGITRSTNLAHQLLDRSVLGNRGRMAWHGPRHSHSRAIKPRPMSTKLASWICLGRDTENINVTYRIDCMAWDPLGVLLAVAQTCNITKQSWIDIYDWDTVNAADRKGRNARVQARARNEKSQLRLDVPPMLQFRIPSTGSGASATKIPWMQWNPFHPDQLAVASRCGSVVYCLDIAQAEASLSAVPPNRIMKPPRHSYWEFRRSTSDPSGTNTPTEAASSCLFVAEDHVIIAFGPSLHCWRYYPKRDPTSINPKQKWQHYFPFGGTSLRKAAICCLERLGREHVLLGSSHGHMALIHWKRVVTASTSSSFSMTSAAKRYSPTVLSHWLAHASLGNQQQIPPETEREPTIMGIRQLQVEQYPWLDNKEGRKRPTVHGQLCGRFRVQWVTRCGWVLSVVLVGSPSSSSWEEYKVRREKPRILHQTDLVNTRLASGGKVRLTAKEWSLPTEPVVADGTSSFLCWQKVAPVTKILPHHDQRVLDDIPSIIRIPNEDMHLFLRANDTDVTHSLTLPDRKGSPKCIAVDPSDQEWAVIATSHEQLYLVKLRCNM